MDQYMELRSPSHVTHQRKTEFGEKSKAMQWERLSVQQVLLKSLICKKEKTAIPHTTYKK